MVISDILGHTSGYVAKKYTQTCCKETHAEHAHPETLWHLFCSVKHSSNQEFPACAMPSMPAKPTVMWVGPAGMGRHFNTTSRVENTN